MRPQLDIDLNPIARVIETVMDSEEIIEATARYAVQRSSNPAFAALKFTPRPSVHPFVWSRNPAANERGRRGYFALIARGVIRTDGERYVRSGKTSQAWESKVEREPDGFTATLRNPSKGATYVYGNEDGSAQQIPGHETTGWPVFRPLGEVWIENTQAEFEQRLPVEIEARL